MLGWGVGPGRFEVPERASREGQGRWNSNSGSELRERFPDGRSGMKESRLERVDPPTGPKSEKKHGKSYFLSFLTAHLCFLFILDFFKKMSSKPFLEHHRGVGDTVPNLNNPIGGTFGTQFFQKWTKSAAESGTDAPRILTIMTHCRTGVW